MVQGAPSAQVLDPCWGEGEFDNSNIQLCHNKSRKEYLFLELKVVT